MDLVESDIDSLFGSPSESSVSLKPAAKLVCPPIPGLYFISDPLISPSEQESLMDDCLTTYFRNGDVNQIMLFERLIDSPTPSSSRCNSKARVSSASQLPSFLTTLLDSLSSRLKPHLPLKIYSTLFPDFQSSSSSKARQVIINTYLPGEGITPHVDLLDRYDDGIFGLSLGSGCVMRFRPATEAIAKAGYSATTATEDETGEECGVYLPPGSVYVMTGDARYKWTHGIEEVYEDYVEHREGDEELSEGSWVSRSFRISITFRWMLPGADVVGSGAL
ncbi:Alpha-ketoglutarate-dependent dioxygenase AlkB-like superfamily protein [Abortiporus biennis]